MCFYHHDDACNPPTGLLIGARWHRIQYCKIIEAVMQTSFTEDVYVGPDNVINIYHKPTTQTSKAHQSATCQLHFAKQCCCIFLNCLLFHYFNAK